MPPRKKPLTKRDIQILGAKKAEEKREKEEIALMGINDRESHLECYKNYWKTRSSVERREESQRLMGASMMVTVPEISKSVLRESNMKETLAALVVHRKEKFLIIHELRMNE
jgi:hypothetical protein